MNNAFNGIQRKQSYGKKSVTAESSFSDLMKQADLCYSKSLRKKAANVLGNMNCYTCNLLIRIAEADLGHYIPRGHYATRYDERNTKCQCQNCNRNLYGNTEIFRERLIAEYGIDVVVRLEASRNSLMKFSRHDLLEIIEKYK